LAPRLQLLIAISVDQTDLRLPKDMYAILQCSAGAKKFYCTICPEWCMF